MYTNRNNFSDVIGLLEVLWANFFRGMFWARISGLAGYGKQYGEDVDGDEVQPIFHFKHIQSASFTQVLVSQGGTG